MGKIVTAFAVPHTPVFPARIDRDDPEDFNATQFATLRKHLELSKPDLIVMFDSDHINTFFLDNLPTFCVGAAARATGPNDGTAALGPCVMPSDAQFGSMIHRMGVESGFDLAITEEYTVDHSVLVPLHYLTPDLAIPVVPVFVNGLIPPLPTSHRVHALGRLVAQAIDELPDETRVAIIASGSVSHEVGGPRIQPHAPWGVPDPIWVEQVMGRLASGDHDALLAEATTQRLLEAGDVSGELLNTIGLLGAMGDGLPPMHLEPDMHLGHIFAGWVRN